jgi:beta-galactosidase
MAINRRDFAKTAVLGAAIRNAAAWSDRPTMAPVSFDRHCWRIGGQAAFLVSGEFHYFRVPKADWKRRMSLLKEAGGNAIATYVPWGLHEPTEGQFVFSGQGGILDLEEFLETAREAGLYVIARPGPSSASPTS